MGKDIRIRITAAENGGLVLYPMADTPPSVKSGEIARLPPLYIVPKVDPKLLGETILALMATKAMVPEDMDIDIDSLL